MRGTIGATYLLGATMLGLALGPYFVGKVATVTGSLATGMYCLFIVSPVSLVLLRSEEHTSELQSLMRISYAVFCLKKKKIKKNTNTKKNYKKSVHEITIVLNSELLDLSNLQDI